MPGRQGVRVPCGRQGVLKVTRCKGHGVTVRAFGAGGRVPRCQKSLWTRVARCQCARQGQWCHCNAHLSLGVRVPGREVVLGVIACSFKEAIGCRAGGRGVKVRIPRCRDVRVPLPQCAYENIYYIVLSGQLIGGQRQHTFLDFLPVCLQPAAGMGVPRRGSRRA